MEIQFGRMQPDATRALIIEMCQAGPISKEELSFHLRRDATYVAQAFLSPMVKDGQISLAIPGLPNHPDQKYTAKKVRKNGK
jgi:ATP-dependent DNA helicase RecG